MKTVQDGILNAGTPQVLLVGNGINLLFNDPSWKKLIENELERTGSSMRYKDIENMPATMQIVVASDNQVDQRMKEMAKTLIQPSLAKEREVFLRSLLDMPVDDILTANYAYELEMAAGMKPDRRQYSAKMQSTFPLKGTHRRFRLFQYYEANGKRIWHVHGDIAKPETMLMGHYYYAKQLRAIQDCVGRTMQRYHICLKQGEPFKSYSWVDQFLTGDVYILGLGMYLCESDLWYLLCCKQGNFPETRTVFYDKDCKDFNICTMLKVYGAEVVSGKDLKAESDYMRFYEAALADIRKRIRKNAENRGGKTE